MKRKITKKVLEDAYELYKQGFTYKEIGAQFNMDAYNLSKQLRERYSDIKIKAGIKKIDQEKFEELWNKGLSDEKIAEYFNVTPLTIASFRTKGKNAGKFKRTNLFSESEQKLTYEQEQFILGSLLGDLNISKPRKGYPHCRLAIVHSSKQQDLFMEKIKILGEFMGSYKENSYLDKRTNNTYYTLRGNSKAHPEFNRIYNLLYIDGVKTITQEYLNLIDSPIALAYWFMDDGDKTGILATNCFSEKEVDLIIQWLEEKWEIFCNKRRNKENFTIYIKAESRLRFEKLISPYIIPSMYYKLKYSN